MFTRKSTNSEQKRIRAFARSMVRSAVQSLFWAIISFRRKEQGYTLQRLADDIGVHKSAVSRWFNTDPNWRLNTVADIANALDVELQIMAVDRKTGARFAPHGLISPADTIKAPLASTTPTADIVVLNPWERQAVKTLKIEMAQQAEIRAVAS